MSKTSLKSVHILFPHQLFKENPLFEYKYPIYLVEEWLFFKQYPFHKQKIAFHRATMKFYESYLKENSFEVHYIDAQDQNADVRKLISHLNTSGVQEINYINPVDNWLEKRINTTAKAHQIKQNILDSPLFLNTNDDLKDFFTAEKKKFHQTTFYTNERKKRDILMLQGEQPEGGKWTFDTENRKKYPAKKQAPNIQFPDLDEYYKEAKIYVTKNFSEHYGELSDAFMYPNTFKKTQEWFQDFLEQRFLEFGTYEDAIVRHNTILHHSVLTPMLNVGLITLKEIIDKVLIFATENKIPINSTEGFVRQIIGWREFIRGIYISKGSFERTKNFWGFERKIPKSFYDGTTGIPPIDDTIKTVLKTGYCHHIERLMVLGNFMLLCEFDPDEVYQWFMELFIDAYDWVMVPNVYGMSQFADGGLMATKPYISGSNYIMKMSDYPKGDWQASWDGLFWRFMHVNRDFFLSNPRLGMLVKMFDKMPDEKQKLHLKNADIFLDNL